MIGGPLKTGCVALAAWFAFVGLAAGQQTDPKVLEEIQALKQGQEEIRKQLQEIKQLLQARPGTQPAPPNVRGVPVELGKRPTRGDAGAKLTLIEVSDFQCPFCGRYATDTHPLIAKEYIDTGKLRYAFMDLPLESIHKQAFKAAEAARCAGDQGKYWEMHARLFANQKALEPWSAHATAVGLDLPKFEACMADGTHAAAIRADMAAAQKLGIQGTPGFLLALTDPKDPQKVTGLSVIRGARPFADFKAEIDRELAAIK
ncbi:MAG: thioredoxin domain-containing protein [Acidobacteria bacterium]|nr:thioredoxin domain-containing protein [Acidobacteriota bacterium]